MSITYTAWGNSYAICEDHFLFAYTTRLSNGELLNGIFFLLTYVELYVFNFLGINYRLKSRAFGDTFIDVERLRMYNGGLFSMNTGIMHFK